MRARACVRARAKLIYTYIHTYMPACMHTYIHTFSYTTVSVELYSDAARMSAYVYSAVCLQAQQFAGVAV